MKNLKLAIAIALSTILVINSNAQDWLANGLVAWYQFNGDTTDSSVNGYNGTASDTLFGTNRFGIVNKSLVFNGSSSVFEVDNFPLLNQSFTYSAWLLVNGPNAANDIQSFGVLGPAPEHIWDFTFDDSGQDWNLWDNLNNTWNTGVGTSTPSTSWVQIVITYNYVPGGASIEQAYENGVLLDSREVNLPINDNGGRTFLIGTLDEQGGQALNGQVDDVRIYDVALTTSEVGELYSIESGQSSTATATAVLDYGFVVQVNVVFGGAGYTNVPNVHIIGGGGSGAQAVAVVANGMVAAINVTNAGYGYTNVPLVTIDPPTFSPPTLRIAPASLLTFSNLTTGTNYQLQQLVAQTWTNQGYAFTASGVLFTQSVAGTISTGTYRLIASPIPAQATAIPNVVSGFVVNATVTSGGSGYVTAPALSIIGGGGTGAMAVAKISAGVVTNVTITSAGVGYTSLPNIIIAAPPVNTLAPAITPIIQLNATNLIPYGNYHIQSVSALGGIWTNWNGGSFTATGVVSSQFLFVTNRSGYFRLLGN